MQGSKKPRASTKEPYDYLAKIVIIGNSAVGKTNILLRFIN
jgi:GTPase SAR1 family protein